MILIHDDINLKIMKEKENSTINTDLLLRQRNKCIVIGNVGFRLKNLWYYFYVGGRR